MAPATLASYQRARVSSQVNTSSSLKRGQRPCLPLPEPSSYSVGKPGGRLTRRRSIWRRDKCAIEANSFGVMNLGNAGLSGSMDIMPTRFCAPSSESARAASKARGEGAHDTSRTVRARRDRTRERGQARGPLDEAGDCHRFVESEALRREAATATEGGESLDEAKRTHGQPCSPPAVASVATPLPIDITVSDGKVAAAALVARVPDLPPPKPDRSLEDEHAAP